VKERVMRKLLAVIIGFLSVTLIAAPAHAAQPLVTEDVRFDGTPEVDPFLSQQCGFPVSVSQTGHFRGTIFYDKDGNARLETGHPSIRTTFTSPYGSIETSDRGLDKYSLNPDGTLLVFGTGIHLRVKGQVYAIGLWRLTVNLETDELVAQEYHGNFDVQQPQLVDTVCSLLGPGSA
jgi:hypothetical protein